MKKQIAFSNFCFAIVLGSFLYLLNLAYINIREEALMLDLKVVGVCVALIAIFVIERAYKLDDDELAMQGIEIFASSLIIIGMQLILANSYPFIIINSIIVLCIILYYILKTIIMCAKTKKV